MNKGLHQWCWKHCNKCDRWLIANNINFQKDNSKKDKLKTICKQCCSIQEKNKVRKKKPKRSKKSIEEKRKHKSI